MANEQSCGSFAQVERRAVWAGRTDYHVGMTNSPSHTIPRIEIPTGGQLLGFAESELSAECLAVSNLQTQLAPFLASMSCQLKVMKLLIPLIEVIKGLPNPPVRALMDFSQAAAALAPCLLAPSPSAVLPFVRDLLCLEIRSLNCLLRNLENVAALAGSDLNPFSTSQVQNILDSYPPIAGLLSLAAEFFGIAGFTVPPAPVLSGGADTASLEADRAAIAGFVAEIQLIADQLGGCP